MRTQPRKSFQLHQRELLAQSGWAVCPSIVRAVEAAGLPPVRPDVLDRMFTAEQWSRAESAASALRHHFADARFADEVTYGVLLVPDAELLDTAAPLDPLVRQEQLGAATPDVFDERLPVGHRLPSGSGWTMVVTATGAYGPSMGSYDDVVSGPADAYTVDGHDTRTLMTRQVWGARVLQRGATPPDCEHNARWTFTLFAGEQLTDGLAESGTVLKGKVRFRLGKPDRGIGSARVAPAIVC